MSARGAVRSAAPDRDDSWLVGLAGRVCAALRRSTVVDVKLKLSRPRATDTSGWLIVVGAAPALGACRSNRSGAHETQTAIAQLAQDRRSRSSQWSESTPMKRSSSITPTAS
jgi:hypothetical protein